VPFPVEKAPTKKIPLAKSVPKSGMKVSKLMNFPVRGLVFERGNTLKDLADVVTNACIWLQDNNVPFNVLISDSGRRIFLFPQVISAAKSHTFTLDHEHFRYEHAQLHIYQARNEFSR
jgi:GDP-L-galactose phosphorylase